MRLLIFSLIICITLPLVMAEDIVLSTNNINYVFSQNITDNFRVDKEKVIIGNDELTFKHQGGVLNITFLGDKKIIVETTVSQRVNFEVVSNNKEQYLYDGKTFFVDSFIIGKEPIEFTYSSPIKGDSVGGENNFFTSKIFEFEISTTKEDDIITGKNFSLRLLDIFITTIVLLVIIILLVKLL